ncbi:MAG: hypothetical protein EB075_11700 [Bacteroidetes bacterium]|nr:hypothetical protein [Bacteroidota bacterium]
MTAGDDVVTGTVGTSATYTTQNILDKYTGDSDSVTLTGDAGFAFDDITKVEAVNVNLATTVGGGFTLNAAKVLNSTINLDVADSVKVVGVDLAGETVATVNNLASSNLNTTDVTVLTVSTGGGSAAISADNDAATVTVSGIDANDTSITLAASVVDLDISGTAGTKDAVSVSGVGKAATGDGAGDSSSTELRTVFAAASDSVVGTSSLTQLRTTFGVGTGAGTSTQSTDELYEAYRNASAFGGATNGDEAISLHTHIRGGADSGSGDASSSQLRTTFAIGNGFGVSDGSVTQLRSVFRALAASGSGGSTATGLHIAPREASGDGDGTEITTYIRGHLREGTDANGSSDSVVFYIRTTFARATGEGGATTDDGVTYIIGHRRAGDTSGIATSATETNFDRRAPYWGVALN